jgi:protein-tyrosine phosphatase
MPPVVIDVRRAEDARDVVHRAVQALVEGRLVVLPTETVYGVAASALNEGAIARLLQVKRRAAGHPLTLAVKSADEAWDYVPDASQLGRRLARRCWPGPVTLVIGDNHRDSLLGQLPPSVRQAVAPNGSIGLRVPAHQLFGEILALLAGPLALSSANRAGGQEAVTAQDAISALGEDVQLVLDDGRSRFGQASSVVRVDSRGLSVLREGVVSQATLNRLASFLIVIVCTGNTCRSPMAEVMMRRRLADRLGCAIGQLDDQGVVVTSAGIAAVDGAPASREAITVMSHFGLDLSAHISQPLTERLIRDADVIFAMTHAHRVELLAQWPGAAERTELLCPDGQDVSDPIGAPQELYRRCADQIDTAVTHRVREFDVEHLIPLRAAPAP